MKLKIEKPLISFDNLMPSGKQKMGSCVRLMSLVSIGYFSVRMDLKVCYALLLTKLSSTYFF